jgi:hypothetical protein
LRQAFYPLRLRHAPRALRPASRALPSLTTQHLLSLFFKKEKKIENESPDTTSDFTFYNNAFLRSLCIAGTNGCFVGAYGACRQAG